MAPPTDEVAPGADAAPATDVDDDARPAAWLADIRARAPWLLEPGGALHWRVTGAGGPDIVPHGVTPPALSVGGLEAVGRAAPRAPESWPALEPSPGDRSGEFGRAGEDVAADDGRIEAPPRWPDPVPERPAPLAGGPPPTDEVRRDADAGPAPETPDRDFDSIPSPLWPADARRSTAGQAPIPDASGPAARPDARPEDHRPGPDLRRPAIHRPSATWPPSASRPATASPVWPPRPHPDGAGLPHPGPTTEPSRPLHRPVTPFVPDQPAPTSPAGRPPAPTWAEDRTGWHASAVPVSRIVDEAALAPWPSLLDDDDDGEDEPDWAALERGFERMLRLEREQRRR